MATCRSVRALCTQYRLSAEELADLSRDLSGVREMDTLAYSIATERVAQIATVEQAYKGSIPADGLGLLAEGARIPQIRLLRELALAREKLALLRYHRRFEELASEPFHAAREGFPSIDEDLAKKMGSKEVLMMAEEASPAAPKTLIKRRVKAPPTKSRRLKRPRRPKI